MTLNKEKAREILTNFEKNMINHKNDHGRLFHALWCLRKNLLLLKEVAAENYYNVENIEIFMTFYPKRHEDDQDQDLAIILHQHSKLSAEDGVDSQMLIIDAKWDEDKENILWKLINNRSIFDEVDADNLPDIYIEVMKFFYGCL